MAMQTTPHTQTQQNITPPDMDLEPNQLPQDAGQGADAELYRNTAGAQSGENRAFHINDTRDNLPNAEQETAVLTGSTNTRLPQSDNQGVTNHSASEESERQQKVVNDRPDANQGVDLEGNSAR
jgi:hypothetical protein